MSLSVLLVLCAFAVGGIPSGVWLARLAGVDVQRAGSGNIGATNVARTAGMMLGLLTLAADVLKGAVPVAAAAWLVADPRVSVVAGAAAFLGHLYSPFLHFTGGKGVATAGGVFLALAPWAVAFSAATFLGFAVVTRYVSLASIVAAIVLPLACAAIGYRPAIIALAIFVAMTIVWRHRANISRLLRGQETRFRAKRGSNRGSR